MNCDESRKLIEAFTDGELDLVRHMELEEHVGQCPACAALAKASSARRAAISASATRFRASSDLKSKVRAALAASVAIALGLGYSYGVSRARSGVVADEAVANHLRSLQAAHLMDVISTDQHTVKPWFAGKLDFSPPVADLADAGYPLAGGRLERIGGHPAAALVFKRKLHVINVYIWPEEGAPAAPASYRKDGFGIVGWSAGGLNFAAVSEIPEEDLRAFSQEFEKRTAPAAKP